VDCGADLAISTASGTCAEGAGESTSLHPADPAALEGVGARLHGLATAHGKAKVARVPAHVSGRATCRRAERSSLWRTGSWTDVTGEDHRSEQRR